MTPTDPPDSPPPLASLLLVFLVGGLFGAAVAMWMVADSFRRLGQTVPFTVWAVAGVLWALLAINHGFSNGSFLVRAYLDILALIPCLLGQAAAQRRAPDAPPAPPRLILPFLALGLAVGALVVLGRPVAWILTGQADLLPF